MTYCDGAMHHSHTKNCSMASIIHIKSNQESLKKNKKVFFERRGIVFGIKLRR
jgi:hypothetical protein